MPRISRMAIPDEKTVYHIISRTALDGFPFGDFEKDQFVKIMKRFSKLYFVDILGFCIMDNHFHALIRVWPEHHFSNEEIQQRFEDFYGETREFATERLAHYREKWASLSHFVKEIKQTFSRFYNKRHNRRGTLWGERFKSVIVENGETLVNCLAYIDLNPVRAGLVERPDDYRWSSLGYHAQTGNRDDWLSFDFGLAEFDGERREDRLQRYRRFVYEAGAIQPPEGRGAIREEILDKERAAGFRQGRIQRFRNRTRYFTDAAIIGSRAFVAETYRRFRGHFQARYEKRPNPVNGLDGLYSLKRFSEAKPLR